MTTYSGYRRDKGVVNEEADVRIRFLMDMFARYEDYWDPEIKRMIRNQRMFWGLNFGQWPSYVVEKLKLEGRRPPTFNIIGKKIQSQIGSFMANGFEVKMAPVTGMVDSATLKLADMHYSDKMNLHWKVSERIALRDMFNMIGYERMYISDEYSELGNIAWEPLFPTHVYLDPGWKSTYVSDIRNYFEFGYYTAEEIMEMYPNAKGRIEEIREREEREGINLGEYHGGVNTYRHTEEKWGDRHKVIVFHHIKRKERMWEYDLVHNCNFPETGFEPQSVEDKLAKIEYIKMAGLNPNTDITIRKQIRQIKYVEAFAPTIDTELFLTSGKDQIQTNNCNIYPIGDSYNGQFKGTTDELFDIQISFNKGEMNIDDIQQRSAKGSFILDEALANGNAQKMREIEQQWNNPAARIWVDEGSTIDLGPKGGIIELPHAPPSPDMFRQNERRLDLADWLSMVPAAMDSRTESTQESGKLYQSKIQVGLIGQRYAMEIYEAHCREKAKAYIRQAKITYAGWPRMFARAGLNESFWINRRVTGNDGKRYVMDDISKLPEMLVILVPSQGGENIRSELRKQYAESLQLLNAPEDRLARLTVLSALYMTYELPEEVKEEIRMAFHISKTNAALQESIINVQAKAQLMQMMMAAQQKGLTGPGGEQQQEIPQQVSTGEQSPEEANIGTPQEEVPFETIT